MSNTFSSRLSSDSEIARFHTWLFKTLFDYGCEKEEYSFVKPSKKPLKNLSRYTAENFAKFMQERNKTGEYSQSEHKDRDANQFMSFYKNLKIIIDEECENLIRKNVFKIIQPYDKYVKESAVLKGSKMRVLKLIGYSAKHIAIIFNTSRQNVENMLAVDGLASKVKDAVEADKITATAALELRNLSHKNQIAVIYMLYELEKKPTVANVRAVVEAGAFGAESKTYISGDCDVCQESKSLKGTGDF